jgi:hypothetical protein
MAALDLGGGVVGSGWVVRFDPMMRVGGVGETVWVVRAPLWPTHPPAHTPLQRGTDRYNRYGVDHVTPLQVGGVGGVVPEIQVGLCRLC